MKIGGVILTRTYNIIGILSCLISFIIMALPMIWYTASALWFFPGTIMILLLSLVIVFCYIKTKNQLHLLLIVLNIIILLFSVYRCYFHNLVTHYKSQSNGVLKSTFPIDWLLILSFGYHIDATLLYCSKSIISSH